LLVRDTLGTTDVGTGADVEKLLAAMAAWKPNGSDATDRS